MALESTRPTEMEESEDDDCILIPQYIETIDLTGDDDAVVKQELKQLPVLRTVQNFSSLSTVHQPPYSFGSRPRLAAIIAPSYFSQPTTSHSVAGAFSSQLQGTQSTTRSSVKCPVCLNDAKDTVATTCGHVFCE